MSTVAYGNHPKILQAMLDFDYMSGKAAPSIKAIIGVDIKSISFFWGDRIVTIPCASSAEDLPEDIRSTVTHGIVLQSARRVKSSTQDAVEGFDKLIMLSLFAEGVPERHAETIRKLAVKSGVTVLGPASVGAIESGEVKLGAAGGVTSKQLFAAGLCGKVQTGAAIISVSGGMLNEIISIIRRHDKSLTKAYAVGGDVINAAKPSEILKQLLKDKSVSSVIFYGELGGVDEYDMAKVYKASRSTKPIISYIGGKISENFTGQAPQFGHAKAIARSDEQTASAKVAAMQKVGIKATTSFEEFEESVALLSDKRKAVEDKSVRERYEEITNRKTPLFMSSVSTEQKGEAKLLGKPLQEFIDNKSFSQVGLEMLLGREVKSEKVIGLSDLIFRLLIDHGPLVSGAVNTIVTARAGRDLASSLATGMLTIGDRFGGATNQAAALWLEGATSQADPADFVESMAKQGKRIAGIGHKKYSLQLPDPRIETLRSYVGKTGKYTAFADSVAKITTAKKSNLILNVDGAIAAIMLDVLEKEEGFSVDELKDLTRAEFFNALFILSRSFGFAAHYMDQKRYDQPLFRLPEDQSGQIV